ncbi:MAG: citrate lyase ACP [Bacteroidetes bacterium HGW-Bacteroidetes-15]|nr:MAG: citrate lyase ACP [Bacteroidetes bacterium HGW-Bacteroidetes-15]
MIGSAGNLGEKVRSDCFVKLELTNSGGINLDIKSKVNYLFGESNRKLCLDIINFFDIQNAQVEVIDQGALPFVIAARLEAAIKKIIKTNKNYLLDMLPEIEPNSVADKNRFSRLYLPGNSPSMMINAGIHNSSSIILDLEDSVSLDKKFEARILVRNALRNLNFLKAERIVRINQIPLGIEDLDFIIPHSVNTILIPKVERPEQIISVNENIKSIFKETGQSANIWLIPIIESAMGVIRAADIAQAADNIVALAIGLEDYTADIGAQRTAEGKESFYARSHLLNVCKAFGLQALDSVFSDVSDLDTLKKNALESKSLGFDGMGCIHPRQVKVINECFTPNDKEIEQAKLIISAYNEALKNGQGVVSLGSKMIDLPIVKRAQRSIDLAIETGKLSSNWIELF